MADCWDDNWDGEFDPVHDIKGPPKEDSRLTTGTYRELYPNPEQWDDPDWFYIAADLDYQSDDDESVGCQESDPSPQRFLCTRSASHDGPHVADDGRSVVAVWESASSSASTPTDTALLDWLASLPTDDGYDRWRFRRSTSGRGWRLHTSSEGPGYSSPREALIAAYREHKQEINAPDKILGGGG